jgi:hypothetical protein
MALLQPGWQELPSRPLAPANMPQFGTSLRTTGCGPWLRALAEQLTQFQALAWRAAQLHLCMQRGHDTEQAAGETYRSNRDTDSPHSSSVLSDR